MNICLWSEPIKIIEEVSKIREALLYYFPIPPKGVIFEEVRQMDVQSHSSKYHVVDGIPISQFLPQLYTYVYVKIVRFIVSMLCTTKNPTVSKYFF